MHPWILKDVADGLANLYVLFLRNHGEQVKCHMIERDKCSYLWKGERDHPRNYPSISDYISDFYYLENNVIVSKHKYIYVRIGLIRITLFLCSVTSLDCENAAAI